MKILSRLGPALRLELAVLLAVLAAICFEVHTARAQQKILAKEVVRLHVVANSNSEADQAVKLSVRDGILSAYSAAFTSAASAREAEAALSGELENIRHIAGEISGEEVRVSLGRELFPQRVYGDVVLPAGEYTALRVVIGEGAGENWWCVMFPPLCCFSETEPPDGEEWDIATEKTPEIKFRLRILEVIRRLTGEK